jgi:hypothetical protein
MSSPQRGLFITFAALATISILLGVLLVRPGATLSAVRGAPPFEFDEPSSDPATIP